MMDAPPLGVFSFCASCLGFSGPRQKHGIGITPSFFSVNRDEGEKENKK